MIKLRTLTITTLIALIAVMALISPAPAGAGGVTFVVNSNGDAADAALNNFCDTVAGPPQTCTLRAAIQEANFSPNNDFINFSNGSGQFTISVNSSGLGPLPAVTQGVSIDGTTQPGYDAGNPTPMVELRGTAQVAGDGLVISGNSTLVRALALTDFPDAGISVTAGANNTVDGSYLGLGLNGATVLGNLRGIEITGGTGAVVGGDTPAERNVISGNSGLGGGDGILVTGGTSTQIKGNYIGLDADGVLDVGNIGDGIEIITAGGVTIGGSVAAARNIISGNDGSGVVLNNSSGNNLIHGNYIGTDVTGALDRGNSFSGVRISDSPNNDVGGGSAGQGNLISGNDVAGVSVDDAESENNDIEGNLIGTNAAGTGFIRNTDGVQVSGAFDTFIGTTAAARNVISGNLDDGVQVSGSASGTRIIGNYIGTDITGAADLGNGANGIQLFGAATGTVIGTTGASNGNVISGNNGTAGILMQTNGGSISSNIIGLNAAGTLALPNNIGVSISGSSNTVGGSLAGQGNVISGNGVAGVELSGPGNFVRGNIIGLDAAGTVDRGNTLAGLSVSSANNQIGGITAESRNVVSGNNGHGVEVSGDASDGNFILGNYIGTDITGTLDRGNSLDGVHIDAGDLNTIGGDGSAHRNVISGNNSDGVELSNDSNTNVIRSNYIGTDVTGALDRGNSAIGINVISSDNNTIGTSGRANVISGNGQDGIEITSASLGNIVQANQIGLASDSVSPLGNGTNGIQIAGSSSNQTIGGNAADLANHIAHNIGDALTLSSGTGNLINQNSMHDNGLLGIDLANDNVVTPNDVGSPPDTDTGANNLQNFPAMLATFRSGTNFGVVAQLQSTPLTNFVFRFYHSPACDPSGNGEGQTFIGAVGGVTSAAPQGFVVVSPQFAVSVPPGAFVTATATDPANNTSEFSNCVPAAGFVVNSSADPGDGTCDGTCTLRDAILNANSVAGADKITFNIDPDGPHTIQPATALPTITDPVTIDGTTQPGFASAPIIELNGASAGGGASGLDVSGGGSTIRGLVINRFSTAGIRLATNGGNVVAGNYIGTNAAGTADLGNGGDGLFIFSSPNNVIGGPTSADRNVISGNNFNGVLISGTGSQGNFVRGNYIGTDASGTADIGNSMDGVSISSADSNTVGGSSAADRNVISGNTTSGVEITGTGPSGNQVQGNFIGVTSSGTAALPNSAGVFISQGQTNTIGGPAAAGNVISGNSAQGILIAGASATGNVVAGNSIGTNAGGADLGNGSAGVHISSGANNTIGGAAGGNVIAFNQSGVVILATATGNPIGRNRIHSNDTLGIDLGGDAVSPNDLGDTDTGANNLQNFPEIILAGDDTDQAVVDAFLSSAPSTTYILEFFYNTACDPSGNGEGLEYLATRNVTTNAQGIASLHETFSRVGPFTGSFITATATDPAGNTSEFSPCKAAIPDNDGDGDIDALDNCPAWPNPSQALPSLWTVPANDLDCDGHANGREVYLGTDPISQCAANTTRNNEPPPDRWPVDMDDNRIANTLDVGVYVFTLNKTVNDPGFTRRQDLNQNGIINTLDIGAYVFVLNETCSLAGS